MTRAARWENDCDERLVAVYRCLLEESQAKPLHWWLARFTPRTNGTALGGEGETLRSMFHSKATDTSKFTTISLILHQLSLSLFLSS